MSGPKLHQFTAGMAAAAKALQLLVDTLPIAVFQDLVETAAPGISNWDYSIHPDAEKYLRKGGVSKHASHAFQGRISYHDDLFWEDVMVNHEKVATFSAGTLEQLMTDVNAVYDVRCPTCAEWSKGDPEPLECGHPVEQAWMQTTAEAARS
jgi:hypothetical protein